MTEPSTEHPSSTKSLPLTAKQVWTGMGIMLIVLNVGLYLTLWLTIHDSRTVRTIGALVGVLFIPVTLAIFRQIDDKKPEHRGLFVGGLIGIGVGVLMIVWLLASYK